MPTVMIVSGFRFFFYSKEESRMHIHVEYQGRGAKIWLDTIEVASNLGCPDHELNRILKLVRKYEKSLKKEWISYFG